MMLGGTGDFGAASGEEGGAVVGGREGQQSLHWTLRTGGDGWSGPWLLWCELSRVAASSWADSGPQNADHCISCCVRVWVSLWW
jgi:hypothetical protein